MFSIVLVTADTDLAAHLAGVLEAQGHGSTHAESWSEALSALALPATRLGLIDARMPGASGEMLSGFARSLPHQPTLRVAHGALEPLKAVRDDADVRRVAAETAGAVLSVAERYSLQLSGLGRDGEEQLQAAVSGQLGVVIAGERGTGKEAIARMAHKLAAGSGRFRVLAPTDQPVVASSESGTLYLENLEQHPAANVAAARTLCEASGWRLMAGTRGDGAKLDPTAWRVLRLLPLRDRPADLRPLTRLYTSEWCKRLGLPRLRIAKGLWALLEQHDWPGNSRELETFVVQAATSRSGLTLSPESLPLAVRALLDPAARKLQRRQAYEKVVEDQLRDIVADYEPIDGTPTLHRLVVDATESALIRLALQRAGNQKAAATLLGLARNTLRERMARLDPTEEGQ